MLFIQQNIKQFLIDIAITLAQKSCPPMTMYSVNNNEDECVFDVLNYDFECIPNRGQQECLEFRICLPFRVSPSHFFTFLIVPARLVCALPLQ